MGPHGIEPISAGELGLPEPEETGATFAANAGTEGARRRRCQAIIPRWPTIPACGWTRWMARPGIYSARWAGPAKDFRVAMARIENELRDKERATDFSAKFVCALSHARCRIGEIAELSKAKCMAG